MSREAIVVRCACANCGCESDPHWSGFGAYRIDEPGTDDEPEIALFCLACAIVEFGRSPDGRRGPSLLQP